MIFPFLNKSAVKNMIIFIFCILINIQIKGQTHDNPLDKLAFFLGTWEHFNTTDSISHHYEKVLNGHFIKMKTEARFFPIDGEASQHQDEGFFSWDKVRNALVFRQFHSEGFINTYVLNSKTSTDKFYVFESEQVENGFGLIAKLTIELLSPNEYKMILHLGKRKDELEACQWINAKRKL